MKWQSGLENVTSFLSIAYYYYYYRNRARSTQMDPYRTLSFIKRIHYLHSFEFDWIEYLTVSDNSSLHDST